MNLASILSSTIDAGKRLLKFAIKGPKDVQTAGEAMPFGLDSVPVKGIAALVLRTTEDGKIYIAGYLNKNQKSAIGEFRSFATNEDGVEVFYTWMKNDGTMEIGGDQNFAVRFNELKTEFNKLKDDYNDLAQKWTAFASAYAPGSPSTTGTPPTLAGQNANQNTSNIDDSKNEKIKTI